MFKIMTLLVFGCLSFTGLSHAELKVEIPRFVMGIYLPGVNDEVNLSDIRVAMDYWMQQVSHEMNVLDGHSEFFVDMQEMSRSFNNHELDMIVAPPLSIVKHFNLAELSDGYVGVRAHNQLNSLILLVKNDSAITRLADLRGKRLLMPENDELATVFIDAQIRKMTGKNYQNFFSSIGYQKKNNRLILDLFFAKADAALVYLSAYDVMSELNPQLKAQTKILAHYPLRSKNYSFFRKDFPYTASILNSISQFTESPRGHQILEIFKTEEIANATIDELAPIKALYDDYRHINPDETP